MNKADPKEITVEVALAAIRPSPTNPRKTFDEAKLRELAASIKLHGVLEDVLVRPRGGKMKLTARGWDCDHFEVVAGERRYRAAKLAGLTRLQVKVRDVADAEMADLQMVENEQREDLKPSERAASYAAHAAEHGQAATAKKLGKSESYVREWLRLAKAPADLAAAVDAGKVHRAVAELVCRVGGEEARRKAACCVMAGRTTPPDDAEWASVDDVRANMDAGGPPLTFRETKELIARHFQRELGRAPFDRKKPLPLLPSAPACEACPKRVGNLAKADPDGYAGVRADVCTDPDCYGSKIEAYRRHECEKFGKRIGVEGVRPLDEPWRVDRPPKGYCDLNAPIAGSELDADGGWGNDASRQTVADVLANAFGWEKGLGRSISFDAKGKPRTLARTADVRKRLIAAGLMSRPTPAAKGNVGTRPVEARAPAPGGDDEEPVKLFVVSVDWEALKHAGVIEFEANSGATFEELRGKAEDAVIDFIADRPTAISYGYVPADVADRLSMPNNAPPEAQAPAPAPAVCRPITETRLVDVPGVSLDDAGLLSACGLTTLGGVLRKCEQGDCSPEGVLREFSGAFTPADAERLGGLIEAHVAASGLTLIPDGEKPTKGKRKAVTA